ncbi:uncharacterized protein LOC108878381 [Lates calcarifer]|uniref:Uncharacterized protein LOC108878381 n=1 Tax=Lates calcarifer TaxID=8187 RepID=A0AAJ7PH58_LATCA|nr:uncharacterized protein LOC108878381 [Lates calcarifer]
MRAVKHVGSVMNDRRKHQAGCGADESMYVHSKQRRNIQSKPVQESTAFTLLPPRPRSCVDPQLSSRGSEPLGLQVQGLCCPLQQRPGSGRVTPWVTPQSRVGADGSRLILLSSLKGRLPSRAEAAARSTTEKPVMDPQGGAPNVSHHRDRVNQTAETPITPCNNKSEARPGQPGATTVSELHLYLPSSLCEDEEQDSEETEEMTPSAPDIKPINTGCPADTNQSQQLALHRL